MVGVSLLRNEIRRINRGYYAGIMQTKQIFRINIDTYFLENSGLTPAVESLNSLIPVIRDTGLN